MNWKLVSTARAIWTPLPIRNATRLPWLALPDYMTNTDGSTPAFVIPLHHSARQSQLSGRRWSSPSVRQAIHDLRCSWAALWSKSESRNPARSVHNPTEPYWLALQDLASGQPSIHQLTATEMHSRVCQYLS